MRIACPGRIDLSRCGGAATVAARSCAVEKVGKFMGSAISDAQIATSSGISVSGPACSSRDKAPSLGSQRDTMSSQWPRGAEAWSAFMEPRLRYS